MSQAIAHLQPRPGHLQKICVLGLGYMGLPTAALFASHGHRVLGVDTDSDKVSKLQRREYYLGDEPGLKEIVIQALNSGNLIPSSTPEPLDVFIISVPTPLVGHTRNANLSYVFKAAETIGQFVKSDNLVVLESTVPPGTVVDKLIPILEGSGLEAGKNLWMSHCPERAIPGSTLKELVHNPRIIGGIDDTSTDRTKGLYRSFVEGEITTTDATTAEMVKLMENTTRDIQIAAANEFTKIADSIGVDVWAAIALANKHPRINILSPGPGVGGHCIAVDPYFLLGISDDGSLIRAARTLNESMPPYVIRLIGRLVATVSKPTISVFGVAYKADVDDTRTSPAQSIIDLAHQINWNVKVHDPIVSRFSEPLLSMEDSLTGSDCIVLVADHRNFVGLKPEICGKPMCHKNIVDTRNMLDYESRELWRKAGFSVLSLGRMRQDEARNAVYVDRLPLSA